MNVAITRARCLVAIFGNEKTLSQSPSWNEVIKYAKENGSFYLNLPIAIMKQKSKPLIISKNSNNLTREMVSEFKEDIKDAGYKLSEIYSDISDSNVRVLWPDEYADIMYLKIWVQKRVQKLNKHNKHVTLAYDAESVCIQFGDIFDDDVDYYNYQNYNEVPEIKTNESIIISFYQHKGDHNQDLILVNIMKPLLEHTKITLITFDFTFDFDKFYDFGINLKTKRIIDTQLMILPDENLSNDDDFIKSGGWKSISHFIRQAKENDDKNNKIIVNAKESIKNNKKDFPHEENSFLIKHFSYPNICQYTKLFLEYSAGDIFYTAVVAVDVLSRGELETVKERSLDKFNSYIKYRKQYGNVRCVRDICYIRDSFLSITQMNFTKESQTHELLNYYKKLKSYNIIIDNYPELFHNTIKICQNDDLLAIKKRYNEIINIMKDSNHEHLGNIKDKAILSYVEGVKKTPGFVLRVKDETDVITNIELENVKEESLQKFKTINNHSNDNNNNKNSVNNNNNVTQVKIQPTTEPAKKKTRKRKSKKKKHNKFIYTPGEDD